MTGEPEEDEDEALPNEITVEPEVPCSEVAGFLFLSGERRDIAIRAYALEYVMDGEGVLLSNWKDEVRNVEKWLKDGTFPADVSNIRERKNGLKPVT